MSYTKSEILNKYNLPNHNLDSNKFIKYCKSIGLIIVKNDKDSSRGKFRYDIIEDQVNLLSEIWITCIYNNKYEVSNLGRCRFKNTKRLNGYMNDKGYLQVSLGEHSQIEQLHRVIYFSFNPEMLKYSEIYTVDHINGIKTDNRIVNLQLLTRKNNTKKMNDDETTITHVLSQVIQKYGYEKTKLLLQELL